MAPTQPKSAPAHPEPQEQILWLDVSVNHLSFAWQYVRASASSSMIWGPMADSQKRTDLRRQMASPSLQAPASAPGAHPPPTVLFAAHQKFGLFCSLRAPRGHTPESSRSFAVIEIVVETQDAGMSGEETEEDQAAFWPKEWER